jgi:hypothetical protein
MRRAHAVQLPRGQACALEQRARLQCDGFHQPTALKQFLHHCKGGAASDRRQATGIADGHGPHRPIAAKFSNQVGTVASLRNRRLQFLVANGVCFLQNGLGPFGNSSGGAIDHAGKVHCRWASVTDGLNRSGKFDTRARASRYSDAVATGHTDCRSTANSESLDGIDHGRHVANLKYLVAIGQQCLLDQLHTLAVPLHRRSLCVHRSPSYDDALDY